MNKYEKNAMAELQRLSSKESKLSYFESERFILLWDLKERIEDRRKS